MPNFVVIELEISEPSLIPDYFAKSMPVICSHRYGSNSLSVIDLSESEILQILDSYGKRWAVGVTQIWEVFPELRENFFCKISRSTIRGQISLDIKLSDTIFGDTLLSDVVSLYDSNWIDSPPPTYILKQSTSIHEIDFSKFSYLNHINEDMQFDLTNCQIYFCANFSIPDTALSKLSPNIRFLTPNQLFNHSNLLISISNYNKSISHIPANVDGRWAVGLPTNITGAFLVADSIANFAKYAEAMISRIFAATALCSDVSGRIVCQIRFGEGNFSYINRDFEYWHRPYQNPAIRRVNYFSGNHSVFQKIIALVASSNFKNFETAKEDFRILAIDTVEDSRRSGLDILQIAQIWMAIERILSFYTETTVQLALALSALDCKENRVEAFKSWKISYQLRSRIVHGYSFRKDSNLSIEINKLASAFRRLIMCSFDFDNGEEFRSNLINHVVSGKSDVFDG